MPLTFGEVSGNIVRVTASGKLTDADYQDFVPRMESLIRRWGKLRMLFHLEDFEGWDLQSLWQEVSFEARHRKDLKRVAVVGSRAWEKWVAQLSRIFTGTDVRFFEEGESAEARTWIEQGW